MAGEDIARFDINGAKGPTQAGWIGVEPTTGVGSDGSYTLSLLPITKNFHRDRGTAETKGGADNNDNQVPAGKYSAMYRDFLFILPGRLTGTISGLAPGTTYPVTVFSWDSAQPQENEVNWGPKGDDKKRLKYLGDFQNDSPKSLDPKTDKLTDYSVTFHVKADSLGNVVFEGVSKPNGSVIFLNGVVVGSPISRVVDSKPQSESE